MLGIKQWDVIESYHQSFLFSNLSHHRGNISPSGVMSEWSSVLTMGRLVADVKCPKQKLMNNFILRRRGMITSWVRPSETD